MKTVVVVLVCPGIVLLAAGCASLKGYLERSEQTDAQRPSAIILPVIAAQPGEDTDD